MRLTERKIFVFLTCILTAGLVTTILIFSLSRKFYYHLPLKTMLVKSSMTDMTSIIPNVVHMTYISRNHVPPKVWAQYERFAPEFEVRFYDNAACVEYLRAHYHPRVLQRYLRLKSGPHRADLFRYALLYKEGGIYLDVKTRLVRPLRECVDPSQNTTVLAPEKNAIYQGIIMTRPGEQIFLNLIYAILETPDLSLAFDYLLITRQMRDAVFQERSNWRLFVEKCSSQPTEVCEGRLDRYNLCCSVVDDSEEVMFATRFSDFPWDKPF